MRAVLSGTIFRKGQGNLAKIRLYFAIWGFGYLSEKTVFNPPKIFALHSTFLSFLPFVIKVAWKKIILFRLKNWIHYWEFLIISSWESLLKSQHTHLRVMNQFSLECSAVGSGRQWQHSLSSKNIWRSSKFWQENSVQNPLAAGAGFMKTWRFSRFDNHGTGLAHHNPRLGPHFWRNHKSNGYKKFSRVIFSL